MYNFIIELKQWLKENRNKEKEIWFVNYDKDIKIPYKEVELIVGTIEHLEQSCDDIIKINAMFEDYNRLLRKENEELKQAQQEQKQW